MPQISPTDDARLDALGDYAVLDTPAEPDFDDIVHIAAHVCATPIALVSLVEKDRQWFKARVGIDACETPITQSVCALGLARDELLIIPDLTADSRTDANTLVTQDPNLRFYAGAPLITPSGVAIGMLCVIDTRPRPEGLTTEQQHTLRALARQVIVQLEYRKAIVVQQTIEAERQLLNEELSHRLKNTLAMVQGIANQTLKSVADRAPVEAFDARLLALSSAHDILMRESWASARMNLIVEGGMNLHAPQHRFTAKGCDTLLGPRGALSTAMLVHELATNAVKYGSLSSPTGHVDISWRIEPGEKGEEFVLEWREHGGPPVVVPEIKGFGSRLISTGLSGTRRVEESFAPSGYEACFRAPLSRMREN
ncbi:HWE histidine kinase domain-containing protein [Sphingomonas montanisoli]|uniref:histidine kinase n=1 Tax=Sphingomonas montanisoli TaxID=2606412 RepID=A0A5D9BZ62_9SPHN|nr:HWE histidine kinase domain-containing protein [Sphingomonas montanisoli]TZG24676.1 GAF domain-containing protein [Sphingomonas montanisoli]